MSPFLLHSPLSRLNLGFGVGCLFVTQSQIFCSYLSHVTTSTIASNPLRSAILCREVNFLHKSNKKQNQFEPKKIAEVVYITSSITKQKISKLLDPQTFYNIIFFQLIYFSPFHLIMEKNFHGWKPMWAGVCVSILL